MPNENAFRSAAKAPANLPAYRASTRKWLRFCVFLFAALSLPAQTPEIATQNSPVIFRSTSNLISVPVVVRDSKGKTVGNLSIDDFQIFDDGTPQAISKFVLEKPGEEESPQRPPIHRRRVKRASHCHPAIRPTAS